VRSTLHCQSEPFFIVAVGRFAPDPDTPANLYLAAVHFVHASDGAAKKLADGLVPLPDAPGFYYIAAVASKRRFPGIPADLFHWLTPCRHF